MGVVAGAVLMLAGQLLNETNLITVGGNVFMFSGAFLVQRRANERD